MATDNSNQKYILTPELNDEENNVSNWYSTNALQGNFSKYQALRFGLKSTDRDFDIVITDTSVESYPILELYWGYP